jgi:hypothetical protein
MAAEQPWIPGKLAEQDLEKIASAIDDSGDTPYINVSGVDGGSA